MVPPGPCSLALGCCCCNEAECVRGWFLRVAGRLLLALVALVR